MMENFDAEISMCTFVISIVIAKSARFKICWNFPFIHILKEVEKIKEYSK